MEARKIDFTSKVNERVYTSEKNKALVPTEQKKSQGGLLFVKVVSIFVLLGLFLTLFIVLKGYAGISALQAEVSKMEKTKKQLLSEKADLTAELEGLKASLKIQEEAKYKLGMVYPTADQIVYLTVEDFKQKEKSSETVNIVQEIRKLFGRE